MSNTKQDKEWRASMIRYLQDREESTSKAETQKLKYKVSYYVLIDNILYKRGHSLLLLQCLDGEATKYVLRQIHESMYGNHFVGQSLSYKVLRQGYYWPDLVQDATQFYKKYDYCQRFTNVNPQPQEELMFITNLGSFTQWELDIIKHLPPSHG